MMTDIVKFSPREKEGLFRNVSAKIRTHSAIIEKDFWVCFVLDYLFGRSPWKKHLAFKGGTSLSKAFNLISRFSEDIDLILDWRVLGYALNEPWIVRSNTKQDVFNKEANLRTEEFLREQFCPILKQELSLEMRLDANVHVDSKDGQTIIFAYPALFSLPGILPVIRLEIGALAAWTPVENIEIKSYVEEWYPNFFDNTVLLVPTVTPERTFWEKATILHHEANRPEHLKMPQRYSRHYYDLYCMAKTPIKQKALNNLDLLEKVVEFKMKFYLRKWAKYSEAAPGTLKLFPPDYRFSELEADYRAMQEMLYGDIPSFSDIMKSIKSLETEINHFSK